MERGYGKSKVKAFNGWIGIDLENMNTQIWLALAYSSFLLLILCRILFRSSAIVLGFFQSTIFLHVRTSFLCHSSSLLETSVSLSMCLCLSYFHCTGPCMYSVLLEDGSSLSSLPSGPHSTRVASLSFNTCVLAQCCAFIVFDCSLSKFDIMFYKSRGRIVSFVLAKGIQWVLISSSSSSLTFT